MTARPQDVALLPCPFCGDTPTMKNIRADENQGTKWGGVVCSCGVVGPEVRTDYMPVDHWGDRAIEAWNARANVTAALASAQAREEELRADVDYFDRTARGLIRRLSESEARAERLEEALRDALSGLNGLFASGDYPLTDEEVEIGLAIIGDMQAALSTNAERKRERRSEREAE